MKKNSIATWFIIILIIATIATSSLWDGLGFALTVFIIIFSSMCIIASICLVFASYEEIKDKNPIGAIKDIFLIFILAFIGIKIIKWLVGVLS